MPKLLGIDPGQRRVGLATSDESGSIANPYRIVDRKEEDLPDALREAVRSEEITRIIVGYPDPLKVDENERTRQVDEFIRTMIKPLSVPHETISERYSTKEARRRRQQRDDDGPPGDDEAAAVILQTYLDRSSAPSRPDSREDPNHE